MNIVMANNYLKLRGGSERVMLDEMFHGFAAMVILLRCLGESIQIRDTIFHTLSSCHLSRITRQGAYSRSSELREMYFTTAIPEVDSGRFCPQCVRTLFTATISMLDLLQPWWMSVTKQGSPV